MAANYDIENDLEFENSSQVDENGSCSKKSAAPSLSLSAGVDKRKMKSLNNFKNLSVARGKEEAGDDADDEQDDDAQKSEYVYEIIDQRQESLLLKFDVNGPPQMGKGVEFGGVKQLMTCPYNETHRVGYGRFALHLMNCRAQAARRGIDIQQYTICQYNATHHMRQHMYAQHLTVCAEFRQHTAAQYEIPPEVFGNPVIPPVPFTIPGREPPSFPLVEKRKVKNKRKLEERAARRVQLQQEVKKVIPDPDPVAVDEVVEAVGALVLDPKMKVKQWMKMGELHQQLNEESSNLYSSDSSVAEDDDSSICSESCFSSVSKK